MNGLCRCQTKAHILLDCHKCRPNTGHSPFEEDKDELMQKYVRISANDAAQGWNQQYNLTLDNCIHGQNCQSRGTCRGEAYSLSHLQSCLMVINININSWLQNNRNTSSHWCPHSSLVCVGVNSSPSCRILAPNVG